MKRESSVENNPRRARKKLITVKSVAEIPDFRSDDEIAAWYQTHSTVLIHDQLESVSAQAGGKLRARLVARRNKAKQPRKLLPHAHRAKG